METKVCRGPCGKTKPVTEFHKEQRAGDGLRYMCKDCSNAYRRRYRYRRPDQKKRRAKVGSEELHLRVTADTKQALKFIAEQRKLTLSVAAEEALKRYIIDEMHEAMRLRHKG